MSQTGKGTPREMQPVPNASTRNSAPEPTQTAPAAERLSQDDLEVLRLTHQTLQNAQQNLQNAQFAFDLIFSRFGQKYGFDRSAQIDLGSGVINR